LLKSGQVTEADWQGKAKEPIHNYTRNTESTFAKEIFQLQLRSTEINRQTQLMACISNNNPLSAWQFIECAIVLLLRTG
jgi:hypothetical protein